MYGVFLYRFICYENHRVRALHFLVVSAVFYDTVAHSAAEDSHGKSMQVIQQFLIKRLTKLVYLTKINSKVW